MLSHPLDLHADVYIRACFFFFNLTFSLTDHVFTSSKENIADGFNAFGFVLFFASLLLKTIAIY